MLSILLVVSGAAPRLTSTKIKENQEAEEAHVTIYQVVGIWHLLPSHFWSLPSFKCESENENWSQQQLKEIWNIIKRQWNGAFKFLTEVKADTTFMNTSGNEFKCFFLFFVEDLKHHREKEYK